MNDSKHHIVAAIYGLGAALHSFEHDCVDEAPCSADRRCEIHQWAIDDVAKVLVLLEREFECDVEAAEISEIH